MKCIGLTKGNLVPNWSPCIRRPVYGNLSANCPVTDEMGSLESVDKSAAELLDNLKRLQREMAGAYPWGRDEEATRQMLGGLRGRLEVSLSLFLKVSFHFFAKVLYP